MKGVLEGAEEMEREEVTGKGCQKGRSGGLGAEGPMKWNNLCDCLLMHGMNC